MSILKVAQQIPKATRDGDKRHQQSYLRCVAKEKGSAAVSPRCVADPRGQKHHRGHEVLVGGVAVKRMLCSRATLIVERLTELSRTVCEYD